MLRPVAGAGSGAAAGSAAPAEEKPVVKKEIFDVKLTAFDEKNKLKVIKEVRTITGLGLKEAKELVESLPKILKKDIKQEEVDAIKQKIEEAGGKIEIL